MFTKKFSALSKKIISGFIAMILLFAAIIGLAACRVEGGGSGGNSSGGSGGISGGNSGSSANGGNNNNEYSEAMQSYLNRQAYYDSVVENYDNYSFSENYMKNDGVDFEVVKQNIYDVMCTAYFYNDDHNTLYVSAKIEQPSSAKEGNYYVNYLFKYSITDKEYEELSSLLDDHNCNAGFMVQEMERLGRMKVVGKSKFVKTAYKITIDDYKLSPYFNPENLSSTDFDIISIADDLSIKMAVRGVPAHKTSYNSGVGIWNLSYNKNGGVYLYNRDVLKFSSYYSFLYSKETINDFTESYKTIKCYTPTMRISSYSDLYCLK